MFSLVFCCEPLRITEFRFTLDFFFFYELLQCQCKRVAAAQLKTGNASDDRNNMLKRGQPTIHNEHFNRYLNFSGEKPSTPVLDTINHPIHMKNLSIEV